MCKSAGFYPVAYLTTITLYWELEFCRNGHCITEDSVVVRTVLTETTCRLVSNVDAPLDKVHVELNPC